MTNVKIISDFYPGDLVFINIGTAMSRLSGRAHVEDWVTLIQLRRTFGIVVESNFQTKSRTLVLVLMPSGLYYVNVSRLISGCSQRAASYVNGV